jgi:hypothetical protein
MTYCTINLKWKETSYRFVDKFIQTAGAYIPNYTPSMSVSPKRNAILLQFLHHFKPTQHHLVPDSGTGRSTLYTILQPRRQTSTLFLKTSRGTVANCLKFVVQFISCSWFWSADLISGLMEPIILVLNVQPTNQDNGRQATCNSPTKKQWATWKYQALHIYSTITAYMAPHPRRLNLDTRCHSDTENLQFMLGYVK